MFGDVSVNVLVAEFLTDAEYFPALGRRSDLVRRPAGVHVPPGAMEADPEDSAAAATTPMIRDG